MTREWPDETARLLAQPDAWRVTLDGGVALVGTPLTWEDINLMLTMVRYGHEGNRHVQPQGFRTTTGEWRYRLTAKR